MFTELFETAKTKLKKRMKALVTRSYTGLLVLSITDQIIKQVVHTCHIDFKGFAQEYDVFLKYKHS